MPWKGSLRDHSNDSHAFLSPSNYHWLNYSTEKLKEVYRVARLAKFKGTRLHDIAAELIDCEISLPKKKKTFNMYVNDAISYHMRTEEKLKYSEHCYGTADAIIDRDILRIHDLKTGKTPASFKQLEIYAALYFLQNQYRPGDWDIELRIYQNDKKIITKPTVETILPIMDTIVLFSDILSKMDEEEGFNELY